MGRPVYLSHPSSLAHDTGPHPENAARITAIEEAMAARDWLGFERVRSEPAAVEQITAVHGARLVEEIRDASAAGGAIIDADTSVSEGSWNAALHAAGGACQLVDRLLARIADRLQRPSAARPPRRAQPGDGVLPVQQRGRGGGARRARARMLARAHPRLGRAPRQRHERHLPHDRRGLLRLDSPVAAVPGHRRRGRHRLG